MIREIFKTEITPFFELIGEIECGNFFDKNKDDHKIWLQKQIDINFFKGAKYYGIYSELNHPQGIACLYVHERVGGYKQYAELLEIGIIPDFRGKGLGSELLKFLEGICREEDLYTLLIATYAGSYKNIGFYGKNGYSPVATIPDVHGPDDDGMIYMRKILKRGSK